MQFHEKNFDLSYFASFLPFQKGPRCQESIFEEGKSLKLPKMQFHEKNFDLFNFTICLSGLFYIFWPAAN